MLVEQFGPIIHPIFDNAILHIIICPTSSYDIDVSFIGMDGPAQIKMPRSCYEALQISSVEYL